MEPAANRLCDSNPTFFAGLMKEKFSQLATEMLGVSTEMLGNVETQEERQELIKYYIFESYSAFSRSVNLCFTVLTHVILYAMFDECFNRGSVKHTIDFHVIRE